MKIPTAEQMRTMEPRLLAGWTIALALRDSNRVLSATRERVQAEDLTSRNLQLQSA